MTQIETTIRQLRLSGLWTVTIIIHQRF